jgi:hydroxyethylthiazole kinase
VDSTLSSDQALEAAQRLVNQDNTTVVISGRIDQIVSPQEQVEVHSGSPLMAQVTGTGCVASALLEAFAATTDVPAAAAIATMVSMGIAGEVAARQAKGPGPFVVHFLDSLASLLADQVATEAQIVNPE